MTAISANFNEIGENMRKQSLNILIIELKRQKFRKIKQQVDTQVLTEENQCKSKSYRKAIESYRENRVVTTCFFSNIIYNMSSCILYPNSQILHLFILHKIKNNLFKKQ